MSILLALLLQVGPDPMSGRLENSEDMMRDRPPRRETRAPVELNSTSAWLESCLDQLESDPARAHAMAQIRRSETSGADRVLANHCLGTASSELGLWNDARSAFTVAMQETPGNEPRTIARFALLAGNAALAAGDAHGALDLLTMAETSARAAGSSQLQAIASLDKARALVALERALDALDALDAATGLAPERSEGWLLKATLLRRMQRLDEAQVAIERAAALGPGDPEIGLEAGLIAVLGGREEAARASWQSVIELQPESLAATSAKAYIAQLGPAEATPPAALAPDEEPPS